MKVLIAGATGAIGSLLLEELCKDERFHQIIAITRRDLALQSKKLKELKIKSLSDLLNIDGDPNFDKQDLDNIDVLFCCLGTTIKAAGSREEFRKVDFEGVKILADLAEKIKIKHFLLISAAGANKNSPIFYNQVKGEAEEVLLHHNIPQISIFRPGLLMTDRKEFRLGELIAIKTVKLLSRVTPRNFTAAWATAPDSLVHSMIHHSRQNQQGKQIIEAEDI